MTWRSDLLAGIIVYCVTAIPVAIGIAAADQPSAMESCFHYDGGHYLHLVERGYWFDPDRASGVAFFPGYPLAARTIIAVTGLSSRVALLLASNLALIAAFAAFSAYLRKEPTTFRWTTLAVLGLWPVGVCFRVAYSESMLLAAIAFLMLGFSRRWPLITLAIIAGTATGIRAVGVAASAAVLLHLLLDTSRGSLKKRIAAVAAIAPLTCWGLLAYMLFQFVQFDAPFAFLQTQRHWSAYTPEHPDPLYKAMRLAIAEPIWDSYVPGSPRHWVQADECCNPLISAAFWNPLLFVLAALLVAFGWYRRWLSRDEAILGLGLLFIPYVSRADEQSMISHARFAAVVLPMYLVMGQLLSRTPRIVRGIILALLAGMLGFWAALFAAGRPLL